MVLAISLMCVICFYVKKRLKSFNKLLDRIEDGDYESNEIPPGFDVTDIINRNKIPQRRIKSMADNRLDQAAENSTNTKVLETEEREILESEENRTTHEAKNPPQVNKLSKFSVAKNTLKHKDQPSRAISERSDQQIKENSKTVSSPSPKATNHQEVSVNNEIS